MRFPRDNQRAEWRIRVFMYEREVRNYRTRGKRLQVHQEAVERAKLDYGTHPVSGVPMATVQTELVDVTPSVDRDFWPAR